MSQLLNFKQNNNSLFNQCAQIINFFSKPVVVLLVIENSSATKSSLFSNLQLMEMIIIGSQMALSTTKCSRADPVLGVNALMVVDILQLVVLLQRWIVCLTHGEPREHVDINV